MTVYGSIDEKKISIKPLSLIFCMGLSVSMILLGEKIRDEIYEGLVFAFSTVIPTLFPFFILSDLWNTVFSINEKGRVSSIFKKLFGISGCGFIAFFLGLICGFPIGVKTADDLYKNKSITKDEMEKICGFVNNPSAAFVISGIGVGIYNSVMLGFLLYLSVVMSAALVGILFKGNNKNSEISSHKSRQSFNVVNSISRAGMTSINVVSCIVFFCGVLGLIEGIVRDQTTVLVISLFAEITSAIRLISSAPLSTPIKLILSGFALGFSGFSVHFQAFSLFSQEIRKRKYLLMKLIQGLISASIITLIIFIAKIKGAAI